MHFLKNKNIKRNDSNVVITLDEFLYYMINSSTISTIIKDDVKIKLAPFICFINDHLEAIDKSSK